jgi:uncharacterized membrane protein
MPEKHENQTKTARLVSLDALRGLIMALMALDHANHFIAQQHSPGEYWGGGFPTYDEALPFLTRLFTHLCAPGFFFLMGAGMLLFAHSRQERGWSKRAVVGHFWMRGALLMALQFLLVNRAWERSPGGWPLDTYVGVLFALGGAMVLGSLLLWLKPRALLALTVALLFGTELLTPDPGRWREAFSTLQRLLLIPGGDLELWVNFPVLPWLELVTLGMLFARWLLDDPRKALRRALYLGAVFALAFFVLRYRDGFGNVRPRAGDSWMDFLNVVKYPPSITFTLLTMGANLGLLGLFAQAGEKWQRFIRPLAVFGRTPLFFYLAHLFLYAAVGLWLTPDGVSIARMYLYWLLGLLILWPVCWFYGTLKQRRPENLILRLL